MPCHKGWFKVTVRDACPANSVAVAVTAARVFVEVLERRLAGSVGAATAHAMISQIVGRETIIEKGNKRLIRPGDNLVLVRKRDGFVNALTRSLKRPYNVPVAGADRLKLTSHIAVQDLLALGRFLLLPGDDLSLASLLKSPLFNHSEDALMELAAERPEGQSLWDRLAAQAETVLEVSVPGVLLLDAVDLPTAVRLAADHAEPGEAVVMSPACASLDMFDNYGHRAQVFIDAVRELAADAGVDLEGGA